MKVVQRKIIHDIGQSLSLARFPHLSYPVHRHDEYELVIMTSGTGREYIGQAVADYRAGDMTLIGRDIPHLHLCDTMTGRKTGKGSTCEILYFSANLFPENMSGIPEYAVVAALLEKSAGGIRYSDTALTRDIRRQVKKLDRAEGIVRNPVAVFHPRQTWPCKRNVCNRAFACRKWRFPGTPDNPGQDRALPDGTFPRHSDTGTACPRDRYEPERPVPPFPAADRKNSFRRTERNPYQPCLSPAAGHATGHLCHRLGIGICQPVPFQPPVQVADWPDAGRIPEKYPE